MPKISLIIEKTATGFLGRVLYEDNLIVTEEPDIPRLTLSMQKMLNKYHLARGSEIDFQYRYDLTSLFEAFQYLKVSRIAEIAGLNASLLRQYVSGNKHASSAQARRIELAIHQIAKDLSRVHIHGTLENL